MWGFESLLPCQVCECGEQGNGERRRSHGEAMGTQAVKVKNGEAESGAVASAASGALQKVTETARGSREFLHDVRLEMKQVTWPTREDVVSTTWVVVATVAFFGAFLFLVDQGLQRVVQYVLSKFGG